jgi:hypothetical protein
MLVGEATASGPLPIPTTERTCGLPGASSATVTKASAGPTEVGEKLTSKEHVARGCIGVAMQGSVPTNANDDEDGPDTAMLETLRGASPVLMSAEKRGGTF